MHDRKVLAVGNGRAPPPEAHDALLARCQKEAQRSELPRGSWAVLVGSPNAMKDIASTMLRGSGSPREPGAGYLSYGTSYAAAAESACESTRASERVAGRPMHSGSAKRGTREDRSQLNGAMGVFEGATRTVEPGRDRGALPLRLDLAREEFCEAVDGLGGKGQYAYACARSSDGDRAPTPKSSTLHAPMFCGNANGALSMLKNGSRWRLRRTHLQQVAPARAIGVRKGRGALEGKLRQGTSKAGVVFVVYYWAKCPNSPFLYRVALVGARGVLVLLRGRAERLRWSCEGEEVALDWVGLRADRTSHDPTVTPWLG